MCVCVCVYVYVCVCVCVYVYVYMYVYVYVYVYVCVCVCVTIRYDEFVFEMFYDEFVELLERLAVPGELDAHSLLQLFNAGQEADCYTWYMRLLTAGSVV
jgi:hypothetical protein